MKHSVRFAVACLMCNNDRILWEPRNSLYLPTRWNVDLRYSRYYTLSGNRRVSVQAEFKNIFNNVQESGVNTNYTVDTGGYPVDPVTLVRLPLTAISAPGTEWRSRVSQRHAFRAAEWDPHRGAGLLVRRRIAAAGA